MTKICMLALTGIVVLPVIVMIGIVVLLAYLYNNIMNG
jgi:hypothetical protein